MDKVIVAEKMATLGQVAAAAGAADVAQGAEMLATSEDIAVMSGIVRALSAKDLERGLATARIAGEFAAVGDLAKRMGMPVLAAFVTDRSNKLRSISVENLLSYSGTRALSEAMALTGARVGDLGVGEVAEGITRLAVAGRIAERSDELAEEGAAQAYEGSVEMGAGEEITDAARAEALKGVGQIAEGSAEMATADVLGAAARKLDTTSSSE
jgi:hypothetical protein